LKISLENRPRSKKRLILESIFNSTIQTQNVSWVFFYTKYNLSHVPICISKESVSWYVGNLNSLLTIFIYLWLFNSCLLERTSCVENESTCFVTMHGWNSWNTLKFQTGAEVVLEEFLLKKYKCSKWHDIH